MLEKLGRNDPCYCGSNKKYKNCHLKPFFPKEFFDCKISEFEDIKFENRIPPNVGIEVGEVKVYYRRPYPWDQEISDLFQSFDIANWVKISDGKTVLKKELSNFVTKLRY